MTACILIITLAGEVVGCLPPEQVAAREFVSEQDAQWERLLEAVEQAKEKAK